MDIILILILILAVIMLLIAYFIRMRPRKQILLQPLPLSSAKILSEFVPFYNKLARGKKEQFEKRVQCFLSNVRITGVNTNVDELDKVLIAASAIIPIFAFPEWEYFNLHEVLLYPDSFNEKFQQEGSGRDILGVVGTGAFQHVMILSKAELRQGFMNNTGKNNTSIHEFVHLIDKTDGEIDGIPEVIMPDDTILPWLNMIRHNIDVLRENESDINPYAATNPAEYFAVVSEYFFERPDLLQEKHPQLYDFLVKIFRQQPPLASKK